MDVRLQNQPAYRRLKSSMKVYPTHVSYWLGADHLLVVDVVGFVERYRQIRLEDIELILIRPTALRLILGSILGAMALPLVALTGWLLYVGISTADTDWYVGAAIAGFALAVTLAALAWVTIGGRTCQTRLVTGVQEIRLAGLYRVPRAQAFANELRTAAAALTPTAPTAPTADPSHSTAPIAEATASDPASPPIA